LAAKVSGLAVVEEICATAAEAQAVEAVVQNIVHPLAGSNASTSELHSLARNEANSTDRNEAKGFRQKTGFHWAFRASLILAHETIAREVQPSYWSY
jgi:ectoine hydroxylase-related dioxygenase (phytanoyl-CoA dioxygenase family)